MCEIFKTNNETRSDEKHITETGKIVFILYITGMYNCQ